MMLKELVLGTALLAAVEAGAAPIPVTFFHSPADDGSAATLPLLAPNGNITINLWADPTAVAGGVTFGVQDVVLRASGAVSVVSFACDSGQGGCLAASSTQTQIQFTAGDDMAGNAVVFPIGTLVLNVLGAGKLELISGTALDNTFGDDIIPHVVVSFAAPEPAAIALLALGLGGLTLLGRRRAIR